LLVSGTAGITGEDTVAPDDLQKQLTLTLEHLAALGGGLNAYCSVTAYVPRATDVDGVFTALKSRLSPACEIHPVTTDLCRPELRVEIEGVAVESGPT
jgi:enamine deaminase RidA (YjgF/YER057c/UK114 family)